MQAVLRSIALLDGTFSEVGKSVVFIFKSEFRIQAALKKRTNSTVAAPPITLKRNIGYGDEAVSAKKNRMNVDSN
jgi:hypothetical protein